MGAAVVYLNFIPRCARFLFQIEERLGRGSWAGLCLRIVDGDY